MPSVASPLPQPNAMLGWIAAIALAVLFAAPSSRAQTLAEHCPAYVAELRSARDCLARGDRAGAIRALHEAQDAIGDCLRRDADDAGEITLLAAIDSGPPVRRAAIAERLHAG